jgi:hypothetical protein
MRSYVGQKVTISRSEQVQLLRSARAWLSRDTAQSFEQALDTMADGKRGAAARARELGAAETF